jgi:hypothetical protein
MAVKTSIVGLQRRTDLHFNPEDGESIYFWSIRIFLQIITALQPRRPTSSGIVLNVTRWLRKQQDCQVQAGTEMYTR